MTAFSSKINSVKELKVTEEVIFPFKDLQRPAFIVRNDAASYHEVIDKETGIVLFAKNHDRIKKETVTAELSDTNMIKKNLRIQYEGMNIPYWFGNPGKWWSQGMISDEEYLSGIGYLLKNRILQI